MHLRHRSRARAGSRLVRQRRPAPVAASRRLAAAIADAGTVDGDTITVAAGTYNEDQLLVNEGRQDRRRRHGQRRSSTATRRRSPAPGMVRLSGSADQDAPRPDAPRRRRPSPINRQAVAIKTPTPARSLSTTSRSSAAARVAATTASTPTTSSADIEIAEQTHRRHRVQPDPDRAPDSAPPTSTTTSSARRSPCSSCRTAATTITTPQRIRDNEIVSAAPASASPGALHGDHAAPSATSRSPATTSPAPAGTAIGLTNGSTTCGRRGRHAVRLRGRRATDHVERSAPAAAARAVSTSPARSYDTQITGNTITGFETGIRAVRAPAAGHSQNGTAARSTGSLDNTTPVLNNSPRRTRSMPSTTGGAATPARATPAAARRRLVRDRLHRRGSCCARPRRPRRSRPAARPRRSPPTCDTTSDGATPAGNEFPNDTTIDFATDARDDRPGLGRHDGRGAASTLTSGATAGTATVTATLDNQSVTTPVAFTAPVVPTPVRHRLGGQRRRRRRHGGGGSPTAAADHPGPDRDTRRGRLSLRRSRPSRSTASAASRSTADTAAPGVLVARGTAEESGAATRRLVGKRQPSAVAR